METKGFSLPKNNNTNTIENSDKNLNNFVIAVLHLKSR
jgi:hypothetical protein